MRAIIYLFLLLISNVAIAHDPDGSGCDEIAENHVSSRVYFSREELDQIKEIEKEIYFAENIFVDEYFGPDKTHVDFPSQYAKEISWDDAKKLILMGLVTVTVQSHDLTVSLKTKSGRSYKTKEPKIDDVYRIQRIIDPCGIFIQSVTE